MQKSRFLKYFVLFSLCVFSHSSQGAEETLEVHSLNDLIRLSQERSESLKALTLSIESLEAEIRSRDLELSTKLATELAWVQDRKSTLTSPLRKEDSEALDLDVTKLFATGTSLALSSRYLLNESAVTGKQNVFDWDLRLSQALWKNAFGRATHQRQESDKYELQSRRYQVELQRQTFLLNLETLYWDLIYSLREQEIRQSNIERSDTLEKWIRARIRHSAAEPVDLLQVQAQGAASRLDLIASQNRISTFKNQLQQLIPGLDPLQLSFELSSLEKASPSSSLPSSAAAAEPPLRLDTLASQAQEKKLRTDWHRTEDATAPLLDVYVGYGKNGMDPQMSQAFKEVQTSSQYNATVGVLFSLDLDRNLTRDRARSGELQAASASLQTRQLERASALDWKDLSRSIESLKNQVQEAQRLAEFQKQKSLKERVRLQLGRSTVFQSVTFDIDAANAELRYYQTLATLRKTEARTRLFSHDQESL